MSWNSQDIGLACIGGALIGIATSMHFMMKGRITGFSGILYSITIGEQPSLQWKVALMMGVVLAPSIFFKGYGFTTPLIPGASNLFDQPEVLTSLGWGGAVVAGSLVGFGTKLGNGCTSGHGVCGIPRFSMRSIINVCCFMVTGLLTASVKYQVYTEDISYSDIRDYQLISTIVIVISSAIILVMLAVQTILNKDLTMDVVIATLVGFIFGMGLTISGMVKRTKVLGFLTINENWDPSLAFVMGVSVAINLFTFRLLKKPLFNTKYEIPAATQVDWKIMAGGAIFGVGWGIGGFCPGPVFALFTEFTLQVNLVFVVCFLLGQQTAAKMVNMLDERNSYKDIRPI